MNAAPPRSFAVGLGDSALAPAVDCERLHNGTGFDIRQRVMSLRDGSEVVCETTAAKLAAAHRSPHVAGPFFSPMQGDN